MIEKTTAAGSMALAPNRTRLYRLSNASTAPIAEPARATSGNDLEPTSSNCRNSSRLSKGRLTEARVTCQTKMPSSPNHSSKPWIGLPRERSVDFISDSGCGASWLIQEDVALELMVITVAQGFDGEV